MKVMTLRLATILVFLTTLVACGGDGGGGSSLSAPQAFTVAYDPNNDEATLNWSAVDGTEGYNIYWNDNGETQTDWALLATTVTTNYVHTSLTPGVTYNYRVYVISSGVDGAFSTSSVTVPVLQPEQFEATVDDATVVLTWVRADSASEHRVYWNDGGVSQTDWALLATTSSATFTHSGLSNGVTYNYRVNGVSAGVEGPYATLSAIPRIKPEAPSLISFTVETTGAITLEWPVVADATSYRVYYDTSQNIGMTDSYIDTNTNNISFPAEDGQQYYFRVVGVNVDLNGTLSNEISVISKPLWSFITPGYGAVATNGITHDSVSGLYVGVGDKGLVTRSTDGVNWSVQHSGISGYDLQDVVWTGSRFVAIGSDYGSGSNAKSAVIISTDGITWKMFPEIFGGSAKSIVWNGSQLLVVGYGMAAYSDNQGDNWTSIISMSGAKVSNAYFMDVIWDGSQFVIGHLSGTAVSSDLANWSFNSFAYVFGVAYSGAQYVAAGPYGIYYSSDLTSWTLGQSVPAGSTSYFYFYKVIWDSVNNQFIAYGTDPNTANTTIVFTSPDGVTWTEAVTGVSQHVKGLYNDGAKTLIYGDRGFMQSSTNGSTWTSIEAHEGSTLTGLTHVGSNGWAAVGTAAMIGISADGSSWSWATKTCSTWTTGTNWTGITHNGSQYIVTGHEGCIMTSPDGSIWTEQTSGVTDSLSDVAWDGSQFVVIGANGVILTSSDGSTWTPQTSGVTASLVRVVYGNNQFVAAGNSGVIITSADGINWIQQSSGITNNIRALSYRNGAYLIGTMGGRVLTSSDANSWTDHFIDNTTLRSACVTDTGYVALGDNGIEYTSSDGVNWAIQAQPPRGSSYRCLINNSGRMMVSGGGGLLMSR